MGRPLLSLVQQSGRKEVFVPGVSRHVGTDTAAIEKGIEDILEAIIERIPPPSPMEDDTLRASVFDSLYDSYRGVVSYVRVFSGTMGRGTGIRMFATKKNYEVKEVGVFTPKQEKQETLAEELSKVSPCFCFPAQNQHSSLQILEFRENLKCTKYT